MKSSDDEMTRIVCFEQVTLIWGTGTLISLHHIHLFLCYKSFF